MSGGAHLCIPFIGFLASAKSILNKVRQVTGCSGGALVAAAWALEIPDDTVMKILAKHMKSGIMRTADIGTLIDRFGLVDVKETVGTMCKEILREGIAHWYTIKKGFPPDSDAPTGATLTMLEISKLTGRRVSVGVCDASNGFTEAYITPESHPDVPLWLALSASCAVPFAFTPVMIGDSLYCDACIRDISPTTGLADDWNGMVDTLMLEVEVFRGMLKPAKRCPASLVEFGKGIVGVMIERMANTDPTPRARVVTIPRWTEERFGPMVVGTEPAHLMSAYNHGVRCGKEFLALVNKETESGEADEDAAALDMSFIEMQKKGVAASPVQQDMERKKVEDRIRAYFDKLAEERQLKKAGLSPNDPSLETFAPPLTDPLVRLNDRKRRRSNKCSKK